MQLGYLVGSSVGLRHSEYSVFAGVRQEIVHRLFTVRPDRFCQNGHRPRDL